jgi:iron complex outermembrane receptor protein
MKSGLSCVLAVWCLALASQATAQTTEPDLGALSLQALMALPVATPSRVPQDRLRASPSVFVITDSDIRRSGATNIPEVLRLVPGLHVAQIDGNKWAIGIRGFTDRLARAMLVMIDGRAVYSPLFAGTYWEVQDLPLSDIDRIEVIRGPGGTLWGANAVTGIINIIRKTAVQTAGTLVDAQTGTSDPWVVALRHGGSTKSGLQYRLSGKTAARASQVTPGNGDYDDARLLQAGARLDWTAGSGAFTLQGDAYRTVIGQRDSLTTYLPPATTFHITDDTLTGGNVLFRWKTNRAEPRSLQIQAYVDRTARRELTFQENQTVADIDLQQGTVHGRHGLLWGAGFRVINGKTTTLGTLRFTPPNRTDQLWTAFAQDEVRLFSNKLAFTAGTKFEHNDYSGAEWQPSARLLWTPTDAHAVSLSVIRSVRTPSRVEQDFETGSLVSANGPAFVRLQANPGFESEGLVAYEVGVTSLVHPKVLITAAAFRNTHSRVLSLELGQVFAEEDNSGRRVVIPVSFGNGLEGHSTGVEVTADVRATTWLRTTVNYSGLRIALSRRPGSTDAGQETRGEQGSPRHQVQAVVSVTLPRRLSVDWFVRHVSALPALGVRAYSTSSVTAHVALNDHVSVFLNGRNLHSRSHVEFTEGANGLIGIRRAVLLGVRFTR